MGFVKQFETLSILGRRIQVQLKDATRLIYNNLRYTTLLHIQKHIEQFIQQIYSLSLDVAKMDNISKSVFINQFSMYFFKF